MKIGSVDLKKDVLLIAEVGNNHEGDFTLAEELIGRAAGAGAGAVKFQTIVPTELVSALEIKRVAQLEKFRFTYEQFEKLKATADHEGIQFLSTPFDLDRLVFLTSLVPAFKIASGDNDFYPLVDAATKTGKPLIVSSGLLELDEIVALRNRVDCARDGAPTDLVVLHCVVDYPTPKADANLGAIRALAMFGVVPGYSDHTLGIAAATLSVAAGARVVEKHFTLAHDHSEFRDHQLSADPAQLEQLAAQIQEANILVGDGVKRAGSGEEQNRNAVRRSIVAKSDLPAGKTISFEDLSWVRPGDGLRPGGEHRVLGKKLKYAVKKGEKILPEHV